jgi:hypothetical protein
VEKRRYERIVDSLEAEITSGEKKYPGIIMNFSAEGVNMVTAVANTIVEISPSTIIQLKCTLPSGSKVRMDCKVIWFQTKLADHGVAFSMGMEIRDPPQAYKEYIETIQTQHIE